MHNEFWKAFLNKASGLSSRNGESEILVSPFFTRKHVKASGQVSLKKSEQAPQNTPAQLFIVVN
ncbi:hypothetical protein KY46_06360 [Photobacterium halotolerans]|uniref:Uncharacterized protein n=1 Tax=Photobacterium halotolerans TaxID=265726 RepID=A0A0F5VF86_9GAMM|nr:hypothetical protein KY46_06360 [Photobacterium halotolerans]